MRMIPALFKHSQTGLKACIRIPNEQGSPVDVPSKINDSSDPDKCQGPHGGAF